MEHKKMGPRSVVVAVAVGNVTVAGLAGVLVPVAHAETTASAVAVGARAGATRVSFAIDDELQASVDVGSGNLMVTSSDRSAPGINVWFGV